MRIEEGQDGESGRKPENTSLLSDEQQPSVSADIEDSSEVVSAGTPKLDDKDRRLLRAINTF